jgi:hypothetical protein
MSLYTLLTVGRTIDISNGLPAVEEIPNPWNGIVINLISISQLFFTLVLEYATLAMGFGSGNYNSQIPNKMYDDSHARATCLY